MKDDFEDYKVDGKNFKLRTVLFVVMLVTAIASITYGVSKIISKEEGYYDIKEYPNETAPLYGENFELHYYLTGSSRDIKEQNNLLESAYSIALERAYKLLDSEHEYEDFPNIAYINNHSGEAVRVNDELLYVLKDAYEKTQSGEGYNMFAGALYDHWNSIFVLDDENEFDPVNNEEERERLKNVAYLCNDLSWFKLSFEDNYVTFNVSKEYKAALETNEESGKLIDLNLLKDSYIVKIVADALERDGFTNGYLASNSGIVYNLSEHANGTYAFYCVDKINDNDEGEPYPDVSMLEGVQVTKGSCVSGFRFFALTRNEFMYHIVKDNDSYVLRSPFVNTKGEGSYNMYNSLYALSLSGDIVAATYENIKAINSSEPVLKKFPSDTNEIGMFVY